MPATRSIRAPEENKNENQKLAVLLDIAQQQISESQALCKKSRRLLAQRVQLMQQTEQLNRY